MIKNFPIAVLIGIVCLLVQCEATKLMKNKGGEVNALELNRLFTAAFSKQQADLANGIAPGELNLFSTPSNPFAQRQSFVAPPTQVNMMNQFNKFTPNSNTIGRLAQTGISVTQQLLTDRFPNDPNALRKVSELKAPPRFCPFRKPISCDENIPYRTLDGSCNNLMNTWWGQVETPYKRMLPADYSDQFKLNEPRRSVDGSDLPNPKDIACSLHTEKYEIEPFITHLFQQWGQFVNHDITSLSTSRSDDPDNKPCNTCTRTSKCIPIMLNPNLPDGCRSQMRHPCIEFGRSSASFGDIECKLGSREQLNLQTPFLDCSHIYGTSQNMSDSLRNSNLGRGFLDIQASNRLMPQDHAKRPSDCMDFTEAKRCFRAGDDRVNQNPSLMSLHTVFLREHNRIAGILGNLNPSWSDEDVFQQTRRILIAIMQHITYNEFLPVLLNDRARTKYGLLVDSASFRYDPSIDPRIFNEYSASAGRFGHSMIRTIYSKLNENYTTAGETSFMLRNSYFRANSLYDEAQGGVESIVRGLLKDPLMKVDRHFSEDLTLHLFETTDDLGRPFHFDLVSINIARGRDHGIPGYTKFRRICGLSPIETWTDMKQAIPSETVEIFKKVYKFVDDVDLFTASLSEVHEENSIVGPTLNCLLAAQFRDLKRGDRFWYETTQVPVAFNPDQLQELKLVTLSKVLCRNLKLNKIQPMAFLNSRMKDNEMVECDSLPDIDWTKWAPSA